MPFCSFFMKSPALIFLFTSLAASALLAEGEGLPETVSYYDHVRPVFQANCQGCHQPAKSKSDYVMTEVEKLIAGGETGEAIIPGKPADSYLLELIVTAEGEERPEMPPKDDPLTDYEVSLVKKWVEQGAKDDTPDNAKQQYSQENPPRYAVQPVIASLDYSPDGKLIAVAGFHEVLVHKADGSGLHTRLVGLSERIQTVRFSPDGKKLAVAGGLPGRMGEVQIWDLEKNELSLSKIVGFDTAYGVSWSPDSTMVAFGLPDNTVRAIKISNGEQVAFMGGHSDWVLDTDWTTKGDHLVSVGRDMSAKLTEVKTERFIDNITSITPGALKGGISAVDTHPKQDHVLFGGSDGVPQIYRTKRETVRKIGDNANLIRKYPAMKGRIWDVAFAPDGKTFAAVSSLNGKGQVNLYRSEYDATITPELKKLFETARRSPDGEANIEPKIEEFQTRGAELIKSVDLDSAMFSVAFSPDGKTVAAGAADGTIRLLKAADLSETLAFTPVELDSKLAIAKADQKKTDRKAGKAHETGATLPKGRKVTAISVNPATVTLDSPNTYNQLVVTGTLDNGDTADLTGLAKWKFDKPIASVSEDGVVRPVSAGEATLTASFSGQNTTVPVKVAALNTDFHPDFLRDVNPVITRLGCNMGTCHGAKDGKNGFKLSLRGYDPLYDVRAFGDDHTSRRVNPASPDDSLMLLKATGAVPHEGKMVTEHDSRYYTLIRRWIAEGSKLDVTTPKVASIELFPKNPVIQNIGGQQQFRVVARYADGLTRDVTLESFIDSGNKDVAEHDDFGLLAATRRGEAPILARYEGAYAATTLTVMGDRDSFTWKTPESWSKIDELVAAKWERMKIEPSGLCTDAEFIRRVYLDLTGLPPTSNRVKSFIADKRPTREKRDALIDELIGSPEYVDHATNKWSDMLQVNSKFLGAEGSKIFRDWIHTEVEGNTPYDEFSYKILTASGSNKENPAASYYKILREPDAIMENTTHLFLATRFNCNKCHDHPFERWTQDQYYETAAFFAQVDLKRDAKNAPKQNIGGSAVEGAKPLYEIIGDKAEGEVKHDRTGEVQAPEFPFESELAKVAFTDPEKPSRREELAAWITSPDNQFFASSYANRMWGYLLGTGVIEPLDDIRAGNPPTNPQLLDHLTKLFIESGFNIRALTAEICKSRTYQLSIQTNEWNETDEVNFSHAKARRLPAETLYDAVYAVTGAVPNIPGAAKGVRASQLTDAKLDLKSGFLANLGRPARESSCECERSDELQMSAVMAFLSGPAIADAIGADNSDLHGVVAANPDDRKLVEELYYRVLSRPAEKAEVDAAMATFTDIDVDHQTLVARLAKAEAGWIPESSKLEIARLRAMDAAQATIVAYQPVHDAAKKKAEAEQQTRITAAAKALDEKKKELPKLVTDFSKTIQAEQLWTRWKVLPVETVTAADKGEVKVLPDGSVRYTDPNKKGNLDYKITGNLPAQNITGIMIEAIPDETMPGFGAGHNASGNFVVSELMASWNPKSDAKKVTKLTFSDAKSDHIQAGFDVKNLFNGKSDGGDKGWAIGGTENYQIPHRALLKFKEPVKADPKDAQLVLDVQSRYTGGDYRLNRFRVWYTTDTDPLSYGLPATVGSAISTSPAARTPEQIKALESHVAENDADLLKKRFAHLKEQRPLPSDPKMNQLQAAFKLTQTEVNEPRPLVQLRTDTDYSIQQSARRRLTAAQDLVWALVNSPSFLFNR